MKKFLTICFVLLLLVPTAVRILDLDLGMNVKRLGLKFPQPYGQAFLDKEYYRALDQYFNDSFALRGPLILAKNWIDFNVFRTTEADEVHIGRLGWLYSRKSISDYRQPDEDADANMERLALQLHAIEKIVSAANRHFLFVVAPSKTAVYPEFVSWSPGFVTGGQSAFDRLLEYLERHPLSSHVRLDQVMNAAKRRQALLYDRTHAYWNGLGASVAAESIHSRIRQNMASPVALHYVSTTDGRVGDLSARIMGIESPIPEIPYQRLPGYGQPDLPSALLYGDGYRHNLMPYLLQMFKQVDVLQADRIPSIQHREDWLAYDCILLEIAQTELRRLHIDLDRIYAALVTQSRFYRRTGLDLASAVPRSRTSLRYLSNGVEIKSLGTGAAFDLTDVPGSSQDVFRVVRLTFATRQSDRMRFQYAFPLREAAVKSIRPGNMDVHLPLPFQKTVSLRIFPGDKAGLILLLSAEMIEFSDPPDPDIQPLNKMTLAGPSAAGIISARPSLKENPSDTGEPSQENWIAVVTDLPDHGPVEEPRSELSAEPKHRGDPAPVTISPGRSTNDSKFRPEYRRSGTADANVRNRVEGQYNHLLIVDAEIELTHEVDDLSEHDQAAEIDPAITEGSEVLPEFDDAEESGPKFSDESGLPPGQEPVTEAKPTFSNESDDMAHTDPVAETGSDYLGLPEMITDREPTAETDLDLRHKPDILPEDETDPSDPSDASDKPDLLPEDSSAADGELEFSNQYENPVDPDLLANLDPDFPTDSGSLPDPGPHIAGENRPDSDQRQPDVTATATNHNGSRSAEYVPAAEIKTAAAAPTPDDVAPEATDLRPRPRVNPNILAKVESPAADPPSITLTDFEDGRIFQRRNRRADIVVSGTFTGTAGTIEARVLGADDLEEVQPWTVIDDAPQNGIFVGVLPGVPEGGWYHLQVRFGSDTTISDAGSHKWGVGILIACLGQSNMKEWFHTGDTFQAHAMIRKYSDAGWAEPGTRGNGAIAFGNRLVKHLGIPVGLLDYAVNGTGLRKEADWGTGYWEDASAGSIYSRFVAGVSGIGGAVEFVIWFQGEADAARKTVTETEYRNSLTRFIWHQIRVDITNASDREHLPFLIIMMTRRPRGHDEPHQAIRSAQKRVAENEAECYLAANTLDLKNRGKQHMHPRAYTTMGYRAAQTVLYILGAENYYRGPTATLARKVNDRRIDISIEHRGGRDFKPASKISGWEILVDEESWPIAGVKRRNSDTISIILEEPLIETATVRYLYGAMPDARHPVVDNSPLALPLEPYQTEVP
ncbi:MAG: sialate O-acetylesterase [Desulfobacterales bacterium]|nr:sialate O-acetylesterase [Desulfobacterales bacterium]